MRPALVLLAAAGAALPSVTPTAPTPRTPARIERAMDDLVAAYPTALAGHDGKLLQWRKGPATPVGSPTAARTAAAALTSPEIADIFAWPYPLGAAQVPYGDPGRARPAAFFTRLYGDCRKGAVERTLEAVAWPGGNTVRFTRTAGAAAALRDVAADLERLGPAYTRYLWPTSGTYNCRTVAGTSGLSMHAYGAAIDLNAKWGAYWRWVGRPAPKETLPPEIITAFERHGFIWGGKWAHFDTFHFEYRPELIRAARRGE